MTYNIVFSEATDRSFAKFDKPVKRKILAFLEERVKPNPDLLKQALQGTKRGLWKFSVQEISEELIWLENFTSKATQKTYKTGVKKFYTILGIDNIEELR